MATWFAVALMWFGNHCLPSLETEIGCHCVVFYSRIAENFDVLLRVSDSALHDRILRASRQQEEIWKEAAEIARQKRSGSYRRK